MRRVFASVMRGRVLAALAGLAVSTSAHADRIAVEAYVGNRPPDADRVLAPIRPILERHGFVVAPDVLTKRFEAHVWRSGGARTAGPSIFKRIEDGIREFEDAKLSAASKLRAALDLARANPVAWANEPKYRDQVRRGLLYFALALNLSAKDARDRASRATGKRQAEYVQRVSNDERARDEAMDELLRNFSTFVVKADEFGVQAEALFLDASKRMRENGGGSIELDVDDPNVIVYVDEAQQPRKTTIGNVVAGRHRVLVVAAAESREYPLDVLPNRRSRVVVRWSLDSTLKLGSWTGFVYASESDRQREQELFAALARASGAIDIAASITLKADATSLVGRSYDLRTGRALASCTLGVGRSMDLEAAEQFARCLAGEKEVPRGGPGDMAVTSRSTTTSPSSGVASPRPAAAALPRDASAEDEGADSGEGDDTSGSSPRWMVWTAFGSVGVAAIGGGLTAKFVLDGRAEGDKHDRVCAVMCTSQQAKAIIADQDSANRRAWIAAGVSGAAVVGGVVLFVLWHRSGSSSAKPIAQISVGGASVGWSVEF